MVKDCQTKGSDYTLGRFYRVKLLRQISSNQAQREFYENFSAEW